MPSEPNWGEELKILVMDLLERISSIEEEKLKLKEEIKELLATQPRREDIEALNK